MARETLTFDRITGEVVQRVVNHNEATREELR
jgi:hypothetical protein